MKKLIFVCLALLMAGVCANGQLRIGVETGAVFTGYNHLRIPSKGGTFLSLTRDMSGKPSFHYRIDAEYTIKQRHHILMLYAPLTMHYRGSIDRQVVYTDKIFAPDTPLKVKYRFNSYRLTYRYDILKCPTVDLALGLSLKIRDAAITLYSADEVGSKKNVGFVPLVNFHFWWQFHPKMGLLFEGDALGAKQGRAEDVLLALTYAPSKRVRLDLGYRMLEGGSDSKEVYTFSMFNYAVVGFSYTFGN